MIGPTLQKTRIEKKISFKKAYEDTRIGIKFLVALEEDNYDLFSAGVYLKGFLRNYANYLGLNGDELVHMYEEQYPQIQIKPEIVLKRLGVRSLRTKKIYKKKLKLIVISVFCGIGVIAVIFMWLTSKKSSGGNLISVIPEAADKEQGEGLYLQADIKETTWIRLIVDGIKIEERNFYPGETKFWNARKKIELRIGNVWGLNLKLNGKLIDVITPSKGAILDLTLDRDMLKEQ